MRNHWKSLHLLPRNHNKFFQEFLLVIVLTRKNQLLKRICVVFRQECDIPQRLQAFADDNRKEHQYRLFLPSMRSCHLDKDWEVISQQHQLSKSRVVPLTEIYDVSHNPSWMMMRHRCCKIFELASLKLIKDNDDHSFLYKLNLFR